MARFHVKLSSWVVLSCLICCAIGLLAFFWALRPCFVNLEPGVLAGYSLTSSWKPIPSKGEEDESSLIDDEKYRGKTSRRDFEILCLAQGNEVALLHSGRSGQDSLHYLRFQSNGQLDQEFGDNGALGYFDFDLLPLPESIDQEWAVEVHYGLLPEAANPVRARVKRVKNTLNPEFELRIDHVEWVDKTFRRIADLRCRYRYDSARQIVDWAKLKFEYGVESPDVAEVQYFDIAVKMELESWNKDENVIALQDSVSAVYEAQYASQGSQRDKTQEEAVIKRLLRADGGSPRLQALATRLLHEVQGTTQSLAQKNNSFALQIGAVGEERKEHVQAFIKQLQSEGWPAFYKERGGKIIIALGPYAEKRQRYFDDANERFARSKPFWITLP